MIKNSIFGLKKFDQKIRDDVERVVESVVKGANLGQLTFSLAFVFDAEIQELNLQYRHQNKPTDVLTFSAMEGPEFPGMEDVLGEIVISVDTAIRQASDLEHSVVDEVAVLLTHGIFHLLGLDHERGELEAVKQAECEMTVLDCAGINPKLALCGRNL